MNGDDYEIYIWKTGFSDIGAGRGKLLSDDERAWGIFFPYHDQFLQPERPCGADGMYARAQQQGQYDTQAGGDAVYGGRKDTYFQPAVC